MTNVLFVVLFKFPLNSMASCKLSGGEGLAGYFFKCTKSPANCKSAPFHLDLLD
jgi:hypothetical protein